MKKSRFSEEKMVKILREADRSPVRQLAKKYGVSEQTIYATLLLSAGFDLNQISKQLGPGSAAFTERVYAKWMPEPDGYVRPPEVELPPDALGFPTPFPTPAPSGVPSGDSSI
jgi:hypothetical protein